MRLQRFLCVTGVLAALFPASGASSGITRSGPAPQAWTHEVPPPGVREIRYPSATGKLLAWYAVPSKAKAPYPLVVYLHGGFAFSTEDFEAARPFLDAGFALLTPTFRGENGNPGNFEMLLGEVDDVIASIRWAQTQPLIDRNRIYVFGHSTGGALASLTALRDVSGLRGGGAASGLYGREIFDQLSNIAPFNISDAEQRRSRLFLPQAAQLKVPFVFYLESKSFSLKTIQQLQGIAAQNHIPLSATIIPGDHYSILPVAIRAFIARLPNPSAK